MSLFLDEAGYTGPDLVNQDQPVYVLASTSLSDNEAEDCVAACFRRNHEGRELKFSRLSKTQHWRAELIEFIRGVPKDKIAFFVVHKEFALLAYLLDFWLEPLAFQDGVNFYERGANIALSNVSYITLQVTLGSDGRRELLRRFQVMTRDRTAFAYDSFWETFYEAVRKHKLVDDALGALIAAEQRLGPEHLQDLPHHLLDLGDYGVLDTVIHWRKKLPADEFVLVHDQSKMIERNRDRWLKVLSPDNPQALVGFDRRTVQFPLPVRDLVLAESHTSAALQVADIIAGAARTVWHAKALGRATELSTALLDAGIADAAAGGIWPTARISPEELETEGPSYGDTATFIARLLKSQNTTRPDDKER